MNNKLILGVALMSALATNGVTTAKWLLLRWIYTGVDDDGFVASSTDQVTLKLKTILPSNYGLQV